VVTRAVFLDRDGVISANVERDGRPVAPTTMADFRILPGVEEATQRLKDLGFVLVVVTNQPDITTGRNTMATLELMHGEMRRRLPLDDIRVCVHVDADGCNCRKPKPGMLIDAAHRWSIDLCASRGTERLLAAGGERWRVARVSWGPVRQTTFVGKYCVSSTNTAAWHMRGNLSLRASIPFPSRGASMTTATLSRSWTRPSNFG
jgi:histidinol-phosphate phosphatase family protein